MASYDPTADRLQEREDRFDDSVDNATHAVMEHFNWLDLPDGVGMTNLMYRVNDALTAIFADYKPNV